MLFPSGASRILLAARCAVSNVSKASFADIPAFVMLLNTSVIASN
nr:MAG TPA: hypothetical protein [Caudoviricetes sp.]